jgi:hypothetical protein
LQRQRVSASQALIFSSWIGYRRGNISRESRDAKCTTLKHICNGTARAAAAGDGGGATDDDGEVRCLNGECALKKKWLLSAAIDQPEDGPCGSDSGFN